MFSVFSFGAVFRPFRVAWVSVSVAAGIASIILDFTATGAYTAPVGNSVDFSGTLTQYDPYDL